MIVTLDKLILETEIYIKNCDFEQYKQISSRILIELNKIKENEDHVVPAWFVRDLIEAFDLNSEYWTKYFYPYWNSNEKNFPNPYEGNGG